MLYSRRNAIQLGCMSGAALFLKNFASAQASTEEPHFFVTIFMGMGIDNTYLFDGRPLNFTKHKKIQNYSNQEPFVWKTKKGECLASPVAKPLEKFKSDLCIVNGLMMAHEFEGHGQNELFFLTGSAFGGNGFIPQFYSKKSYPLSYLNLGASDNESAVKNSQLSFSADKRTFKEIQSSLKNYNIKTDPAMVFLQQEMLLGQEKSGNFFLGKKQLLKALEANSDLASRILKLQISGGAEEYGAVWDVGLIQQIFATGLAPAVYLNLTANSGGLDVHGEVEAAEYPKSLGEHVSKLANIFDDLKNTPFNSHKSLWDVTTVMVTSEFGRTMRQIDKPIDKTGTDHNPLSSFAILAGKGIRGNQVVGASDLDTLDASGNFTQVSGAHRIVDSEFLKLMSKPFDFKNQEVRKDLPAEFDVKDYLTMSSLMNGLYSMFGVEKSLYRTLDRRGTIAAPLTRILL